jgi:hypothetical protein
MFPTISFSEKYRFLYSQVISKLKQHTVHHWGDISIIIHWRRGDQLWSRCGFTDKSVNCKNVAEFIQEVNHIIKLKASTMSNHYKEKLVVYISTNERDKFALQQIEYAGFKTVNSF